MDDDSDENLYRNVIEIIDYSSDDDDDPLRGIPTLSPQVLSQKPVQNQTFGPCKWTNFFLSLSSENNNEMHSSYLLQFLEKVTTKQSWDQTIKSF